MKITLMALLIIVFTISSCNNDDDPCIESIWYEDIDNDGFGNSDVSQSSCTQPENFVSNSDDIDDTNANLNPNTVWQGDKITFTKIANADWTLAANQDQITSNVSITRANNKGLFNIVVETEAGQDGNGPQPSDTEWAFGNISDGVDTLTFTTWGVAHSVAFNAGNPSSLIGQDMVVHLITDDIYIDIKLLSWSGGGSGGGFSYERSTMN